MTTPKTPFHTIYVDIVHVEGDETNQPDKTALCNATNAKHFSDDLEKVTCNKCRKKWGLK
jgi:hypothetical protein